MKMNKIISIAAALAMFVPSAAALAEADIDLSVQAVEDLSTELSIGFEEDGTVNTGDSSKSKFAIVVQSVDDTKKINRLTSAQLKFKLEKADSAVVEYTISPATNVSLTDKNGFFEFNYDGNVADSGAQTNKVTIGYVEFKGYGSFKFGAIYDPDAMVNTTTENNNIVTTYTADGATGNTLDLQGIDSDNDGKIDTVPTELDETGKSVLADELKAVKNALTINVVFPNDVKKQDAVYTDMHVTISGGDIKAQPANGNKKEYVIDLGQDNTAVASDDTDAPVSADGTKGSYTSTYTANVATPTASNNVKGNAYTVVLSDVLTKDVTYTVTVSGAGYRTYRYTVLMDDAKTIFFWNNVIDNEEFIEDTVSDKAQTNYLAGDLVSDGVINIYDLSAVVSYFGERAAATDAAWNKAKYDLNRDSVIDSKDISYVLVSWDK